MICSSLNRLLFISSVSLMGRTLLIPGENPGAQTNAATALNSGDLVNALKRTLAERVLSAEMDYHLGDDTEAENSRNGYGRTSVSTGAGKIEIAEHLREIYGMDASAELISTITDAVLDEVTSWQQRPLDPVYPLVFFDAIRVKIRDEGVVRNKAIHIALGVMADGTKVVLGMWIEQNEGAKFWLRVMNELKNRGVEDILLAVVDGLKGFPEAITAVFPETIVQTCIVHLLRNSMDFVSYKDRKAVAAALKDIYRAVDARAAEAALADFEAGPWGQKYPAIGQSWRRVWQEVIPFFGFPGDVRRIIYTTNAIEALNSKLRRAIRARGHFPSDEAAAKLLCLTLNRSEKDWAMPPREWAMAKAQFAVIFGDRFVRALAD